MSVGRSVTSVAIYRSNLGQMNPIDFISKSFHEKFSNYDLLWVKIDSQVYDDHVRADVCYEPKTPLSDLAKLVREVVDAV